MPLLVIVSGAPGSGKSTLARLLADELRLPLLMKDELKEAVADAQGAPADVAASMRLGDAAYGVLDVAARRVLAADIGLIVESNFRRGLSEAYLEPIVELANARLVHCTAPPDVLRERYRTRFERGERHPAHLDADRAAALDDDLRSGRFEPMELGVPTLTVDTEAGYRPTPPAILAFCRAPA
jgi:predicted kinase